MFSGRNIFEKNVLFYPQCIALKRPSRAVPWQQWFEINDPQEKSDYTNSFEIISTTLHTEGFLSQKLHSSYANSLQNHRMFQLFREDKS